MNVAAYQEKEKNDKTGKRKAGEEKNESILKRLRAILLRLFRGLHGKKMLCVRGVPGVTGTLGRPTTVLTQPKWGWGPHHLVKAAVEWCSSILLALHVYTIYTTEILHFTIQKDRSQYVFWGRTESR